MFTTRRWKNSLFLLAVVPIALTLAKGSLRTADSAPPAGQTLLTGSGVPAPVRSILQRACQNCHSDNTAWPWYAAVPPVSWQVRSDVARGRAFMNLSRWSDYSNEQRRGFMLAIQAATQARIMPPPKYVWVHSDAKLSDAELKLLGEWALAKTGVSSQNHGAISR